MSALRPRITVGVPVYNGERYLAATLDSLLDQSVRDFVILIGDNASTDGTADIARAYAARDARVRHVRHARNIGAAANYTRLCEMATTEYFRWCAADDCAGPRFLELSLDAFRREPGAVLVYPRIMMIDGDGQPLGEYEERLHLPHESPADRFLTLLQNIRLCNAMYGLARTAAMQRTRLMGGYRGSDIVFQAELSLYGKFIEVPEVAFFRRMHQASFTSMSVEEQIEFNTPGKRPRIEFYWWRHLREHVHSVLRAPLPRSERTRMLRRLTRLALWGAEDLVRELPVLGRTLRVGQQA